MVGAWLRSSQGESLRPEGGRFWKLCTTHVTWDREVGGGAGERIEDPC